jgi:hypothetical protein
MLLTIYLAALALNIMGNGGGAVGADPVSFALNLLLNLGFAVGAACVWWVLTRCTRMHRLADSGYDEPANSDDGTSRDLTPWLNLAAIAVLLALVAVAVSQFLLLGLAIVGLFFRPGLGPWLNRATRVALLLASLALGLMLADAMPVNDVPLVDHVEWWHGLILGAVAFGAQIVVALPLTRKMPSRDRVFIAFSQQSGITAIILALLLERSFAGTVAVVAPAIIVVNILHVCSTAVFTSAINMYWLHAVRRL